jgi:hypothetical protein
MANNNRTEAQSAVTTALVPTLTLAQHAALLNNEINTSVVFDKDIIAAETPGGGSVTVDFSNKDTATITTAVSLAVSFTGLQNGAVKYVAITKQAANIISFVGAVDMTKNTSWLLSSTSVCYRISNKNGVIYIEGLTPDFVNVTEILDIGDWDMDASSSVFVPHGLGSGNQTKIRSVSAIIRTDSGTLVNGYSIFKLETCSAGVAQAWVVGCGTTTIRLDRLTGGLYDSAGFDSTSYNRGWVLIEYVP